MATQGAPDTNIGQSEAEPTTTSQDAVVNMAENVENPNQADAASKPSTVGNNDAAGGNDNQSSSNEISVPEQAANKVMEALKASVAEAVSASEQTPAAEGQEPQDKRKKNRHTIKLKSVLTSEPERRRPNVVQEEEFLRAVEAGDFPTVRRMLRNYPRLDVNCTDLLGRTPLRIAVQNENQEIVELLLDRAGTQNMYESLLLAITLDQESIALTILRHPMYMKVEQQTRMYTNDCILMTSNNEDSLFASETTPLILAAQRNSYEVLSLLLDRGAKIEEPHEISCDCVRCNTMVKLDDLRNAKSRLNAYRGLTSEAYICLSSADPVLTAFTLRRKLRMVARNEKHYRDEYEELQKKLGEYVVKLLDCVRGNEELDVLLNIGVNGQYETMGRLNLAIRYDEKKFVAHSSCQKTLATIWYGKSQKFFNRWPLWAKPIFILVCGIIFPITSLLYLLVPTSKVRDFMQVPFIKFIHQSASFFVFLMLITMFSLTEIPSVSDTITGVHKVGEEELRNNLTNAGIIVSNYFRVYTPPGIMSILNVFIVGMVWQECKQLYGSSPKEYFGSLFNLMDTLSLSLYVTSFALRYVSYYKTYESHVFLESEAGLKKLVAGDEEALYWYYWLYADRYYWNSFDPLIIAEGLFAMANVVSFSRLFYLLAANDQLGPLQISLRRMIGDISRFMAIFVIIFVAFMVGLNNLYWYYEPEVRGKVELHTHEPLQTNAEDAFGTVEKTFTTVFWAMFGMGEHDVVKLADGFGGEFTERVGYILFGVYNVAIVIILLNMLIAMMSRSFEAIVNDQDIEWKFARAQLYMDFIQEGCTLPVPFNIIPSPKTIYRLISSLCRKCGKCRKQEKEEDVMPLNNMRHLNGAGVGTDDTDFSLKHNLKVKKGSISSKSTYATSEAGGEGRNKLKKIQNLGDKLYKAKQESSQKKPTASFETVMKRLVKRYIFESENVDSSPLEGDMDELKQDLSGLRFEFNNLISHNQKKTSHSISLLATKLDFLVSVLVNQGGITALQNSSPNLKRSRLNSQAGPTHHVKAPRHNNTLHANYGSKGRRGCLTAFARKHESVDEQSGAGGPKSPHTCPRQNKGNLVSNRSQNDLYKHPQNNQKSVFRCPPNKVPDRNSDPPRPPNVEMTNGPKASQQQLPGVKHGIHTHSQPKRVPGRNSDPHCPPNDQMTNQAKALHHQLPGDKRGIHTSKNKLDVPSIGRSLSRTSSYASGLLCGEVDVDSMEVKFIDGETESQSDYTSESEREEEEDRSSDSYSEEDPLQNVPSSKYASSSDINNTQSNVNVRLRQSVHLYKTPKRSSSSSRSLTGGQQRHIPSSHASDSQSQDEDNEGDVEWQRSNNNYAKQGSEAHWSYPNDLPNSEPEVHGYAYHYTEEDECGDAGEHFQQHGAYVNDAFDGEYTDTGSEDHHSRNSSRSSRDSPIDSDTGGPVEYAAHQTQYPKDISC